MGEARHVRKSQISNKQCCICRAYRYLERMLLSVLIRPVWKLLSKASSRADWLILPSTSISLKLLPMLGVPSLPSFFPAVPGPLGLILVNSARCFGLRGPGFVVLGMGMSLAELAKEELTSDMGPCTLFAVDDVRWCNLGLLASKWPRCADDSVISNAAGRWACAKGSETSLRSGSSSSGSSS